MKKIAAFIIILAGLIFACQKKESNKAYVSKINSWHRQRVENLTQPDGWLSLAGLYWLEPGVNTFGSDSTNDLVFPAKAPARIGKIVVNASSDSTVRVQINEDVSVFSSKNRVSKMKLKTDANSEPTMLHLGSLSWYIIERSNHLAIRLKDKESKILKNFKGIDRYPVNKKWRIEATFKPFDQPKEVSIPTVTGRPTTMTSRGLLTFSLSGQTYSLRPVVGSTDDGKFFVIFGDKTNGEQTYGGGRFLYVKVPGKDGITYIDFNKAYNPPCAFTRFATCPLPTAQNRLPIKIEAGEKKYGEHGHVING